jgi:hypothetical protein
VATAVTPVDAMTNAHIYCHLCESIQPLVVDEPQHTKRGPYDTATDLVCGACQFVVATTYTPRRDERGIPMDDPTIRGPRERSRVRTRQDYESALSAEESA